MSARVCTRTDDYRPLEILPSSDIYNQSRVITRGDGDDRSSNNARSWSQVPVIHEIHQIYIPPDPGPRNYYPKPPSSFSSTSESNTSTPRDRAKEVLNPLVYALGISILFTGSAFFLPTRQARNWLKGWVPIDILLTIVLLCQGIFVESSRR